MTESVKTPNKKVKKMKTFEAYWNEKVVEIALAAGKLIEGVIRINSKNYKEAFITAPNGEPDILIEGMLHRNRALNGDVVVCLLLSPEENLAKNNSTPVKNSVTPRKGHQSNPDGPCLRQSQLPKIQEFCDNSAKKILPRDQLSKRQDGIHPSPLTMPLGASVHPKLSSNQSEETADVASEHVGSAEKKSKPKRNRKKTAKENLSRSFVEDISNTEPQEEVPDVDSPNQTDEQASTKKKRTRRSLRKDRSKKKDHVVDEVSDLLAEQCSLTKMTAVESVLATILAESGNAEDHSEQNPIITSPTSQPKETVTSHEEPSEDGTMAEGKATIDRKRAKVVFIKEFKHSRRAIGHLRQWPYGQSGPEPKWVLFTPKDYRIPRLKIPFSAEIATCMSPSSMLYLAQIVPGSWDDVNHPLGSLCYCVGESGDLEVETIALLLEHGVDYSPFSREVLADLPQLPWTIPTEELLKRRDFRQQCIFTIDPADARDLDDAVSGNFLRLADDGVTKLFQISVHIADVSFFIGEGTLLDSIASERATSTYLVDRVIPMLPSVLCEHVCSLNPCEDRLAFSVEWVIDENGEIQQEWFGRSVIRSCAKLSYDHAQAVIEGKTDVTWPAIEGTHSLAEVRTTIEVLQSVAGRLREKRVRQGALRIDLPRLAFSMDWKTRTPTGFRLYEIKESNRLIEEFMLLANMRVAEKIYETFPQLAVLRCHPPPNEVKLGQVADMLQSVGIHLDVSTSASLQQSLIRYGQTGTDPVSLGRNLVLSNLLAKPMQCASYICAGAMKSELHFRHFALSVPFYTHFTSPIRRYPDILVHRLLSAALVKRPMGHWCQDVVKKQLENCNSRKLSAKATQELHSELHLAALIRRSGSIEVKGIVMGVLERAVDVAILYLGIVRRLYLEKLPLDSLRYEAGTSGVGTLTLVWSATGGETRPSQQCISLFSLLEIVLVPHEKGELQFSLVLQRPNSVAYDSHSNPPQQGPTTDL